MIAGTHSHRDRETDLQLVYELPPGEFTGLQTGLVGAAFGNQTAPT